MSYSIKCQHIALKTGNLAFELETEEANGFKKPSWFYTGKADQYLIVVGGKMFRINRKNLSQYVKEYGWTRITSLTAKTQQSQRDIGHKHINATVGLIQIDRLRAVNLIISEDNVRFLTQCS
jgi:hypothetical protein